eukprot:9474573-Prorocentrum_lima.AAC.1
MPQFEVIEEGEPMPPPPPSGKKKGKKKGSKKKKVAAADLGDGDVVRRAGKAPARGRSRKRGAPTDAGPSQPTVVIEEVPMAKRASGRQRKAVNYCDTSGDDTMSSEDDVDASNPSDS